MAALLCSVLLQHYLILLMQGNDFTCREESGQVEDSAGFNRSYDQTIPRDTDKYSPEGGEDFGSYE